MYKIPLALAGITLATATVVTGAASIAGARKAVLPRPKRRIRIQSADRETVTLARTTATEAMGTYRLYYGRDDAQSLLVGEVLSATPTTVTRTVISGSTRPSPDTEGLWSGRTYDYPQALRLPVEDVTIPGPHPGQRAWYFPGPDENTWAIHVHGIHSARRAILLGVPAFNALGMTSLVITYRSDADDPKAGPVTFGQKEWPDLEAAIDYAIAHGASRVVLVGFSMGATMCLLASTRGTHADQIAAMILVSPALDWHAALAAGVDNARLPKTLAGLITTTLCTAPLARLAGLRQPLNKRDFQPSAPRSIPVLIIHSAGDRETPISVSRNFAKRTPNAILEEFEPTPHAMEPNSEPLRYAATIRRFLREAAHL